ncbi:hypothetical protein HYH03_015499 [Edaphochlamys debaryana]|uniref:Kinetochore protein SPC25 n=1 Tax=Edaphochlamys debaryana TaxID=47281 RepID=A0A836BSI2_9CHLO|nr:hypothetical protein HYH03_015499 [Edaphochlamys debaryana]|eukprot:KAG2485788.1 hypothetical protein HYH03_015499 [Edaphochlamys debaryana]
MLLATERKDQHNGFMRDQTDKLNNLHGLKAQLLAASEETSKRLQKEEQELQRTQEDMAGASAAASTAEKKLDTAQMQLRRQQEEYRQRVTELEEAHRQKQRQLDKLRAAVSLFGSRFSLQFRHGQDELCLVLTNVDAFDTDKEFLLSVRITGDTYQVTRCEPMVPWLEELTAEVNRSNDFAAFVKGVRARFVEAARQARGL